MQSIWRYERCAKIACWLLSWNFSVIAKRILYSLAVRDEAGQWPCNRKWYVSRPFTLLKIHLWPVLPVNASQFQYWQLNKEIWAAVYPFQKVHFRNWLELFGVLLDYIILSIGRTRERDRILIWTNIKHRSMNQFFFARSTFSKHSTFVFIHFFAFCFAPILNHKHTLQNAWQQCRCAVCCLKFDHTN